MKIKFSFLYALAFLAMAAAATLITRVPAADAASLFLSPQVGQYQIGQTFDVEARVDSQGQGFNAAQATVQFPPGVLQVKSLDYSSAGSVFNFWLQGPVFSNAVGQVSFIGGSTTGLVGSSIGVLKITFIAKGSGDAPVTINDAAVTASDGSGSNILSSVVNSQFRVLPQSSAPNSPAAATTTPAAAMPNPAPIVRKPTVAKNLPAAPIIRVPLYPDQKKWYNLVSNFLAQWDLPSDISGVSAIINQSTKFTPPAKSEGLYEAKAFPSLSDGIWYLHAMFQNNIGWSPVANYRIAVDTVPPLPFDITALEATATTSPIRTLQFKTSDGLSGMDHYLVRVDDADEVSVASGALTLTPQAPGKHSVTVKAVDAAGNIRENSFQFEIIPLASPKITFIDDNVYAWSGNLDVSGNSIANTGIKLLLKNKNGDIIAAAAAQADNSGNWLAKFSGPFNVGQYYIEIITHDSRGASSLPIDSKIFSIRERPLFKIGAFEVTQFWFFISVIIIMLFGFICGWYSRRLWRNQAGRKAVIAQRDVNNVLDRTVESLDKIIGYYDDGKIDEREAAEEKFLIEETKNNLKKAKKYITDNIKEIND
ncbi:MAG: hypothetical protein PHO56_00370 [Patescibacteria group bacterium]|nr:hypothetical protein [Patescibacteria group bacterium]